MAAVLSHGRRALFKAAPEARRIHHCRPPLPPGRRALAGSVVVIAVEVSPRASLWCIPRRRVLVISDPVCCDREANCPNQVHARRHLEAARRGLRLGLGLRLRL